MTLSEQFVSIILMMASGVLVGAIVDCTRVLFSALSPKSLLRKFSNGFEIILWALLGALTFYILYLLKGGEWRLVDPIAQISGIFLYESLFQPVFRFIGRVIVTIIFMPIFLFFKLIFRLLNSIISLILFVFVIILTPFRKIFNKLYKSIRSIFGRFIFKKS